MYTRMTTGIFRFPRLADEYLSTKQGQWALSHGCGLAAWERIAQTGVKSLDPREMREVYDKVQRNAAAVENAASPLMVTLAKLWASRMKREAELAQRHLNPGVVA